MHRPPDCAVFVARHHWLMSAVILCFVAGVYAFTHNSRIVEFGRQSYLIALSLAALYLITGAMVWRGTPPGRVFNYVLSVLYLVRPPLGFRMLQIAESEEFKAHFRRGKTG